MKGTIKAISTKNNSILFDDGTKEEWLKCDDLAMPFAKKGVAELYKSDDGKTINRIKVSYSNEKNSFVTSDKYNSFDYAAKDVKIVRQCVLKCAVDLVSVSKIDVKEMYAVAEEMEKWVLR